MLYQEFYQSPLGEIRLLADNLGLSGLYFVGQKYDMLAVNQEEIVNMSNSYTLLGKKWLDAYFHSKIYLVFHYH